MLVKRHVIDINIILVSKSGLSILRNLMFDVLFEVLSVSQKS